MKPYDPASANVNAHNDAALNAPSPVNALPMSPAERLQSHRDRLREKLQALKSPPLGRRSDHTPTASGEASSFEMLSNIVRQTWQRHPLRTGLRLARRFGAPVLAEGLRPMAAIHPLRLVTAALGIGLAVMWIRPWRLLPRALVSTALFSIVMPRRTLWQAMLSSGLIDKLVAHSEWLADALSGSPLSSPSEAGEPGLKPGQAGHSAAPASAEPTTVGPAVLQPLERGTDAERAG